jgi:hypothetical protein
VDIGGGSSTLRTGLATQQWWFADSDSYLRYPRYPQDPERQNRCEPSRAIEGGAVTTSDVSPYLLRPVRKLEDAIAETEQQRSETTAPAADAAPQQSAQVMPIASSASLPA